MSALLKVVLGFLTARLRNWRESRGQEGSRFPVDESQPVRRESFASTLTLEPEFIADPGPAAELHERGLQSGPRRPARTHAGSWASRLRDHTTVRDALVAREILGPPLALRQRRR